MARKAVATAETVTQAVEALVGEGLDPTVERVRAKLGGGSFTTISKVLSEVLAQRQTHATQVSEVPADLVEIGQRSVAAIYAAVQRQATAKIELIEADARKQIDAANHARAEAALEIERLEREGEQAAETLAATQKALQDALSRAERAEATAAAERAEIARVESEVKRLRQEQEQLQRQFATADASLKATQTDLQRMRQESTLAREQEQRARDEAAELRGQLKALGGEKGGKKP
jgi:chromosome segregation ATPase